MLRELRGRLFDEFSRSSFNTIGVHYLKIPVKPGAEAPARQPD